MSDPGTWNILQLTTTLPELENYRRKSIGNCYVLGFALNSVNEILTEAIEMEAIDHFFECGTAFSYYTAQGSSS